MLGFETALLYMIPQRNSIRLVTLVRNTGGGFYLDAPNLAIPSL